MSERPNNDELRTNAQASVAKAVDQLRTPPPAVDPNLSNPQLESKTEDIKDKITYGAVALFAIGSLAAIHAFTKKTPLEHRARLNNIIIHALAGEREPFHVNPEAAPSNLIITIRGKAHRVVSPTKPNGTFIETKDVLLKSEDDKCLVADGNPETPIEEVDCPPNI